MASLVYWCPVSTLVYDGAIDLRYPLLARGMCGVVSGALGGQWNFAVQGVGSQWRHLCGVASGGISWGSHWRHL